MPQCHAIDLSNAWVPPGAGGSTWTRHFGRPGGVRDERLWLTIERPAVTAVTLNGLRLPAVNDGGQPYRVEITAVVAARNTLTLVVVGAGPPGPEVSAVHGRCGLPTICGRVRLEITAADALTE